MWNNTRHRRHNLSNLWRRNFGKVHRTNIKSRERQKSPWFMDVRFHIFNSFFRNPFKLCIRIERWQKEWEKFDIYRIFFSCNVWFDYFLAHKPLNPQNYLETCSVTTGAGFLFDKSFLTFTFMTFSSLQPEILMGVSIDCHLRDFNIAVVHDVVCNLLTRIVIGNNHFFHLFF